MHTKVYMNFGIVGVIPRRAAATLPSPDIHPARRFAPRASDTTQADDSQNRLPALSMYD